MKVLAKPKVIDYWEDLVTILHRRGYFGSEEFALRYVNELIEDITKKLPIYPNRPAPKHFEIYGDNLRYTGFKKNKRTTWYVFFETYEENEEVTYLICHVENNHTCAQYL
jgi:hypothetical protein